MGKILQWSYIFLWIEPLLVEVGSNKYPMRYPSVFTKNTGYHQPPLIVTIYVGNMTTLEFYP